MTWMRRLGLMAMVWWFGFFCVTEGGEPEARRVSLDGEGGRVQELAFSPDGEFLAGFRNVDRSAFIVKTKDLSISRVFFEETPFALACLPNGNSFVVVTEGLVDRTITTHVWLCDLSAAKVLRKAAVEVQQPRCVAINRSGESLVIAGGSGLDPGEFAVLKTSDLSTEFLGTVKERAIDSAVFFPDEKHVLFSTDFKQFELDLKSHELSEKSWGSGLNVASKGGEYLASYYDGIQIVDTRTGVAHRLPGSMPNERKLNRSEQHVNAVQFVPNTSLVVIGYNFGQIAVWDLATFQRVRFLDRPLMSGVYSISASGNGKLIAIGGGVDEGVICLYRTENLLAAHAGKVE